MRSFTIDVSRELTVTLLDGSVSYSSAWLRESLESVRESVAMALSATDVRADQLRTVLARIEEKLGPMRES